MEDGMGSKMQVEEFMEAMILDRSAWEIGESLERGGVIRGGEGHGKGVLLIRSSRWSRF